MNFTSFSQQTEEQRNKFHTSNIGMYSDLTRRNRFSKKKVFFKYRRTCIVGGELVTCIMDARHYSLDRIDRLRHRIFDPSIFFLYSCHQGCVNDPRNLFPARTTRISSLTISFPIPMILSQSLYVSVTLFADKILPYMQIDFILGTTYLEPQYFTIKPFYTLSFIDFRVSTCKQRKISSLKIIARRNTYKRNII